MTLLAAAAGGPARTSWMIPEGSVRPKDFAMVKRDGLYHVFYIRSDRNLPFAQTERDLGHAVSADLFHWTQLEPVLPAREASWDRDHVWAPSIVEQDGVYYLFYTGVTNGAYALYQRLGVATSTDLMQWNRLDVPILTCTSVPWCVCDSTNGTPFRDPFVMPDPTVPGRWLQYYSTTPASDPLGMIVGVAVSDGDLTRWSDLKPLWISHLKYTYNPLVESPHLFSHQGLWYLFFTTGAGQPLTFATSFDPLADRSGWIYRGRLGKMLGAETGSWYASEHLADGAVDYFAFLDSERMTILRMEWGSDWRFSLVQPDSFHVQRMTWSSPQVWPGQEVTIGIESTSGSGRSAEIEAFEVDADGSKQPIPPSEIGLPAEIPITGPVTSTTWIACGWPDGGEDGSGAEIVLRLRDRTCETAPLRVLPAGPELGTPPEPTPATRPPGSGEGMPPGGVEEPVLRVLRHSAIGGGPALLADLPHEAPARLDIFDLSGRRVRNLAARVLPRGASVLAWDRRDAAGTPVPRGVYFARLTTPGRVSTARFVVLP